MLLYVFFFKSFFKADFNSIKRLNTACDEPGVPFRLLI